MSAPKFRFAWKRILLRINSILELYNCTSSIDFIRYDTADSLISRIQWSQPQTGLLRLTIDLNQTLWGYDCYYEGNRFNLKLRARPHLDDKLKGITFVIDPGHSPDPGAIGPTGTLEKDVNLAIALELAAATSRPQGNGLYDERRGHADCVV